MKKAYTQLGIYTIYICLKLISVYYVKGPLHMFDNKYFPIRHIYFLHIKGTVIHIMQQQINRCFNINNKP